MKVYEKKRFQVQKDGHVI